MCGCFNSSQKLEYKHEAIHLVINLKKKNVEQNKCSLKTFLWKYISTTLECLPNKEGIFSDDFAELFYVM